MLSGRLQGIIPQALAHFEKHILKLHAVRPGRWGGGGGGGKKGLLCWLCCAPLRDEETNNACCVAYGAAQVR
jgi:hypothetical protein